MAEKPSDRAGSRKRATAKRSAAKSGVAVKTAAAKRKTRTIKAKTTTAQPKKRAVKPSEKRLSLLERVEYGQFLAVERAKDRPKSWPVLSRELGIPEPTLRDLHKRFTEQEARHLDNTGFKVLEQALSVHAEMIAHLSELAVDADSDASKIGATRQLGETVRWQIRLMAAMNRMPRNMRAQAELNALMHAIRRMMQILEQREVEPELLDELLGVIEDAQRIAQGAEDVVVAGEFAELPEASG